MINKHNYDKKLNNNYDKKLNNNYKQFKKKMK